MTSWMRTELLELRRDSTMFEVAAARTVEGLFPPSELPNDDSLDDEDEMAVINTNIFGIRLEVPMGVPGPGIEDFATHAVRRLRQLR